jgi:glycosyltransferase involved in cell wall biosynthesis
VSAPARAPRVACVINTIGFGGVTGAVADLMRHVPPDRFEQRLFVLKDAGGDPDRRAGRLAAFESAGIAVTVDRGEGGRLGTVARLAAWLDDNEIDILHTHSYRPNLYGRMAGAMCRARGLRIVAHFHNQYDDKWDADPDALRLERVLAGTTDAMIAVSESVRRHVAERAGVEPAAIDVVSNGVHAGRFAPRDGRVAKERLGLPADSPVIGLVGRVCEQKGQEDLVEAVARMAPPVRGLRVVLVGDVEDRALAGRLEERVDAAGLAGVVRFVGHRNDMPEVYAAIDVLAAPSRWEGFGLMLVEAMAAGVPIVASRAGAIEEVARDGAVLVPPRDPDALAAALARVMSDATLRADLVRRGHARARDFSWPAAGAAVANVYERVLAR